MILRQWSCSLVTVLIITLVQVEYVSSSSGSSGSRTSRSKSKGKGLSTHVHTSGHQYGGGAEASSASLLMKPSKPDPHFEILDEQKGYKNYYPSRLREGRSRSIEVKRTTLKEAASPSSKKSCCQRKAKSKGLASAASTNPQYTFMKKRVELEMEEVEPTPPNPKFTGSQLISGDAGMSDDFKAERETSRVNSVGRDTGWKILMGPSVSPPAGEEEEEYNYAYNNNDNEDYAFSKRAFTSMTDGEARTNNRNDNHRTITKLPQKGGGKGRGSLKYGSIDDFTNLKRVTEAISGTNEKGNRGRGSSSSASHKSSRMRQVKVQASSIIPKQTLQHKYATITKRQPSKSSSTLVTQTKTGKKVRMSAGATSKVQYSTPIKSSTWEANHRRSHYSRGRGENEIGGFNPSPAMTLDTKKLMLEQMGSGESPTISVYSGERPLSPSRFDRLGNRDEEDEDLITEDDDDSNDGHQPHGFQTKTALNVGEVYSPLISVSTSLNYDPSRRTGQGGGILTASSENFPQLIHSPLDPPVRNEQMEELTLSQDENGITDDDIVDDPPPTQLAYLIPPGSSNGRILVRPRPPSPSTTPMEGSFPPWGSGSASSSSGSLSVMPPFRTVPPPTHASTPPDTFHYAAPNAPSELFPFRNDFLQLSTGYHNPNHKFTAEKPHHPQDSVSSHSHLQPHHHPLILPYPHQPHPHHPRFLPYHHPLGLRKPVGIPIPVDLSSGRKAPPPGTFGEDHHTSPQSHHHSPPPPPPPGVDPDHPAIQHALRNPHALLRDGIFMEPTDGSHIPETTKNYLKYEVHQNSLIPLDKRLVYLSMIFSWMFWITAFYTYYRYAINGHKTNHFTLNVPKDGENPQVIAARAMDTNNPWNFTKVLEYIEIAQKTYEGFDWQDLNCQKRTLCELVQKQQEPWGETGRKLANSNVYRILDSLDGVPVPQVIQTYLKQYKEAITQGRDPTKNCGQLYPQCKFSIKDVLNKAGTKKKA